MRCQPSEELLEGMKSGRYDLIVFTQGTQQEFGELFRTEKMFWVASHGGPALTSDPLPIAGGPQACIWRDDAVEVLNRIGRDYRVAYTSSNATAITSAVLADLAVGFLPESALQPGMRVISEDKGLPRLKRCADRHHACEPRLWRHLRRAGDPYRGDDGQPRNAPDDGGSGRIGNKAGSGRAV